MIKLVDVLGIKESDFSDYKVHFAFDAKDRYKPYKKYLIGEFKNWQESQTNKNFQRKYVLSLIYYDKDKWLFGGVYKILSHKPTPIVGDNGWTGFRYETELMNIQTDLIGRVFVHYKKDFRASYPNLELIPSNDDTMAPRDAYIVEMLERRASINDFLGFDEVDIDYDTLRVIIRENIHSWKAALSNVKGIYLIADKLTGKQYVGSAYGDECIWQRWQAYAANGHGGNVELKHLLEQNGEDYKKNFKYSVLEVCNMNLGNEYIISREAHWKNVLQTREFGLNKN